MTKSVLMLGAVPLLVGALVLGGCGQSAKSSGDGHGHAEDAGHAHDDGHGHDHGDEHGDHGDEGGDSTTLTDEAAKAAGVEVSVAGAGRIEQSIDIAGRIEISPEGRGEVRAWYPGRIMSLSAQLGQTVKKGQVLARVESSESLQTYSIPAGVSGIIVEKNANVGDMAYDRPIYVIANPNSLQASFFLFPRDAESVRVGQAVSIRTLGGKVIAAKVTALLPSLDPAVQTLTAIVKLPASAATDLRAGMAIEGQFVTGSAEASLVVPSDAVQTYEGKTVVFVKTGTTYTARPVQLGRQTGAYAEILGGLEAGETYVTKGAFLIRADIEKSAAGHEH
ncbi:MAG: efflux RND transporter periplasmic adaptor subunit [Asticcacaulis sp.]